MARARAPLTLLALAGVSAATARPLAADGRVARLEPSPIVWLERAVTRLGAGVEEIERAREACITYLRRHGVSEEHCLWFDLEGPERVETVPAFGIDRTEVSQAAYGRCVRAGECAPADLRTTSARIVGGDLPAIAVRWGDAARYCAFVGGRLPTEPEWERAARGTRGRPFPWGRFWNPALAQHRLRDDEEGALVPVGSFRAAATPEGIVHLVGNAAEWVDGLWDPRDTLGLGRPNLRVVRGGGWTSASFALRATAREPASEDASISVGFRCAYDARAADRSVSLGGARRALP